MRNLFLSLPLVLLLLLSSAMVAGAQQPQGRPLPPNQEGAQEPDRGWDLSLAGIMYTGFGRVSDGGSASTWIFGDASFGGRASLDRRSGGLLNLGVDVAAARTPYERRSSQGNAFSGSGDATVATLFATARISQMGGGIPGIPGGGRGGVMGLARGTGLSTYLRGGIGTIAYRLEDLEGTNADLAFLLGGGAGYRWEGGRELFFEWNQLWGIHERTGVEDTMTRHSRIELGVRYPLGG